MYATYGCISPNIYFLKIVAIANIIVKILNSVSVLNSQGRNLLVSDISKCCHKFNLAYPICENFNPRFILNIEQVVISYLV